LIRRLLYSQETTLGVGAGAVDDASGRVFFTDEQPNIYTVKKRHAMKAALEREVVSSRDVQTTTLSGTNIGHPSSLPAPTSQQTA
jgi:hypothetical protein